MNIVHHQYAEPRNNTEAENERAWLEGIHKRLMEITRDLTVGYPVLRVPYFVDNAIQRSERAREDISMRMRQLDEGGVDDTR